MSPFLKNHQAEIVFQPENYKGNQILIFINILV